MKVKSSWRFILVSLLLLVGIGSTQGGVYDGWSYRMKIRVAGYNQAETLTNFPTLVILSTNIPGFLYANFNSSSNGADLRFAASNLTTELNYEIKKWDTNGNSYVWVQIPAIASSNDYIYAYWGNAVSVAPCTTNGATWSNEYVAVWQFETNGFLADSSGQGHTLTTTGVTSSNDTPAASGGGSSAYLDGNQTIFETVGNVDLSAKTAVTIEWYMKTSQGSGPALIYETSDNYNNGPGRLLCDMNDSGFKWLVLQRTAGGVYWKYSNITLNDGQWHRYSATYDRNYGDCANRITLYQDGIQVAQTVNADSTDAAFTSDKFNFGMRNGAQYRLIGYLDEIQVSGVRRSSNWIWASWLNQASNTTFLAFSDAGAQSTSLAVQANPVTGLGSTSATMSGTVLQTGNAGNPDVYLCWGYTDGLTNATSAWAHVEALGTNWGVGQSFSTNITGLLSGSNYSYRCYVTNSTGYDWSDSAVTFNTIQLPAITNLGATSLGVQTATLRGQITSTGGETPSTWFLYWLNGAATTTTVANGTQNGIFSTTITGLLSATNYSYYCVVSNAAGLATSGTQSFQTLSPLFETWASRMKIRIASYDKPETLTNFPALVVLSTNIPDFKYTDFNSSSNGADLRFAASDQKTELNYEIEKWDTNGYSYVWVQIPAIANTNDYIYAYWGNAVSVAPCTTNGATWDSSYSGVWHMQRTNATDSSTNGNNGTANGGVASASGEIGSGNSFDGTGYINVPATDLFKGSDDVTIEFWFNLPNVLLEAYSDIMDYDHASAPNQNFVVQLFDGSHSFSWAINSSAANGDWGPWASASSVFTLPYSQWTHITLVKSGTSYRYYTNGGLLLSGTCSAVIDKDVTRQLRFGGKVSGAGFIKGTIDEARISHIARSSNYVYACWLNQASNTTFLAYSDVGPQSTALAVRANPVTGITDTSATMSGTVLQTGNAGNPDVYLCWGYTDGLTNATSAWAHVEALGTNWGVGQSFSTNITGLLSGSNYSYRCYVTNSTGYDWSDTAVSFQTLSLPVVTNPGATAIGGQIATLQGQIIATGGEPPSTWFLYWRDASATTTTVAKGTQSGVFTTALSGLQIGSNYSYRCVASNGAGIAVSADQSFQTAAGEYIWNGNGADNKASTPGNWVQGVAPSDPSDSIRLDSTTNKDMTWDITNRVAAWTQTADYHGTVTILTRYDAAFPCMTIAGNCQVLGGTWTHPVGSSGNTAIYYMRVAVGGNFTLAGTASINLTEKGYQANYYGGYGPGRTVEEGNQGRGASHGGLGGNNRYGGAVSWDKVYGSITSPTNLGSSAKFAGGGALQLSVQGAATIDGTISAIGGSAGFESSAAGGSIYIEAGSLTGAGALTAAGGNTWNGGGGAGGGGRIAVILTSGSTFGAVAMTAHGGDGGNAPQTAAAGTIYRQIAGQAAGEGTLIIDNNNMPATFAMTMATPNEPDMTHFAAVILTNRGFMALNTNTALNWVSQPNLKVYGPNQSLLLVQVTNGLVFSPDFELANFSLYLGSPLTISGNMIVSNASLVMATAQRPGLTVGGNLQVMSGSTISHWAGSELYRMVLQVGGDMVIDTGSAIDVTGKGFINSQGPGAGYGSNNNDLPGASHGGLSAENIPYNPWASWVTYGSILAPTNFGSGAILSGGGAVQATVIGTTHLAGSLLAKGSPVGMAGNAGGSVFLTTGSLEGSGLIDASANFTDQYGGGGGRIAVILKNGNSFDAVTMQAFGGGNSKRGAAGTVYRETLAQGAGRGVVTVNNGGVAAWTTDTVTPIPPSLSTPLLGLKFVALDVTNNANVSILTNITMGNLFLRDDSVRLRLNGNTLTLKAVYHADWGTTNRVVYASGEIIWDPGQGTIFTIR